MRTIANVVWVVVAGLWLAIGYVVAGTICCFTIVGIPFGLQAYKLAGYALAPYGHAVVERPRARTSVSAVGNVVWLVCGGIWLAVAHVFFGVLLCLTIVGIPFGIASIRMADLALSPFGKEIVDTRSAAA